MYLFLFFRIVFNNLFPLGNSTTVQEEPSSAASCFLCTLLSHPQKSINTKLELQREKISRWEKNYVEEKQHFPLASFIMDSITNTRVQLELNTQLPRDLVPSLTCPYFFKEKSFVQCEFLLPAFKQCIRELELLGPFADICFSPHGVFFLGDGSMGINKCGFHALTEDMKAKATSSQPTTTLVNYSLPSPLAYYQNMKISHLFHIKVPLRQLHLFPKLCSTQNQFANSQYLECSVVPFYDYIQLHAQAESREIFELLYPYSKLSEACLSSEGEEYCSLSRTV